MEPYKIQIIFYLLQVLMRPSTRTPARRLTDTFAENEYCAENTYHNNLTTIEEAVRKCSNDPQCAAIEDRFGDGEAPIGLCRKFKGKRSGSGSFLLRRGNHKVENE